MLFCSENNGKIEHPLEPRRSCTLLHRRNILLLVSRNPPICITSPVKAGTSAACEGPVSAIFECPLSPVFPNLPPLFFGIALTLIVNQYCSFSIPMSSYHCPLQRNHLYCSFAQFQEIFRGYHLLQLCYLTQSKYPSYIPRIFCT